MIGTQIGCTVRSSSLSLYLLLILSLTLVVFCLRLLLHAKCLPELMCVPVCTPLCPSCVLQGHRPLVFFTRVGKPSIRMAVSPHPGAEKKSADR